MFQSLFQWHFTALEDGNPLYLETTICMGWKALGFIQDLRQQLYAGHEANERTLNLRCLHSVNYNQIQDCRHIEDQMAPLKKFHLLGAQSIPMFCLDN